MHERPRVLVVDDSSNLLNAIRRVLRKEIELVTAEGGAEAIEILSSQPEFAVLVSDQNMPNMTGDVLLAEAAKRWPNTVRVMLTGNDDQSTAIAAVNNGQVFRFVRKPCEPDQLLEVIEAAAAQHHMITVEKRLLERTLAGSIKVLSDVLAVARPDLFQRATKVRKGANLVAKRMQLPNDWELDLAAMLYPLGLVAIPDDIAIKYMHGHALSPAEQHMIDQGTEMAAKLIKNIPKLENVADAISMCRKGFDGSGFPTGGARGKNIPFISRILRILIDLVDATATDQTTLEDAGDYLRSRAALYDPDILKTVIQVIEGSSTLGQPETNTKVGIKLDELRPGDIVLEDILDKEGKLLLVAGSEITEVTIHRLTNWGKNVGISGDIVVSR